MTSLTEVRNQIGCKQKSFYDQMYELGYITRNAETNHWEATPSGTDIGLYQHHYPNEVYPPSLRASDEAIEVIREKITPDQPQEPPVKAAGRYSEEVALIHSRMAAIEAKIDSLLLLASRIWRTDP